MSVLTFLILVFVGVPLLWAVYVYWRMRRTIAQLQQVMRQAAKGADPPRRPTSQRTTGGEYADFEDLEGPVTQPPQQPVQSEETRIVIEDAEFEEIDE